MNKLYSFVFRVVLFLLFTSTVDSAFSQCIKMYGMGVYNKSSSTLNIPVPLNDIEKIEVEALYKGGLPAGITFKTSSQNIYQGTGYAEKPNNLSSNSSKGRYRAQLNAATSVELCISSGACYMQSFVAYVYLKTSACSDECDGQLNDDFYYVYQNSSTQNFSLSASSNTRNLKLKVPLAEMTNDSRIAEIELIAGNASVKKTVNTFDKGRSLTFVDLELKNVPGSVTNVQVKLNSPSSNGDSYLSGTSLLCAEDSIVPSSNCEGEEVTYDPCIEVFGRGVNCLSSATLNIGTPVSEIQEIIVEAVYKGGQPTAGSFSGGGQTVSFASADAIQLDNVSGTSNKGVYRATLPAASSVTLNVSNNTDDMHSLTAYVVKKDGTCDDNFSSFGNERYYTYQNTNTVEYAIPATVGDKNITVQVPIAEMNNDSRTATITLKAGSEVTSKTINTFTLGKSLNIVELSLNDVPGSVTQVEVELFSPSSNGDSYVNGDVIMNWYQPCTEKEVVCERPVGNTRGCSNEVYVLYLVDKNNNAHHLNGDSTQYEWKEYSNGTAVFKATGLTAPGLSGTYDAEITFSGRTTTPPANSPKNSNCFTTGSTSGWLYYPITSGTIQSSVYGTITVGRMGPSFQQGNNANIIQAGYGASGWLTTSGGNGQFTAGDVNLMLGDCKPQPGPADYCGRIKLEIDQSKVSGNNPLNHFPVYVDLTNNELKTTANGGFIENSNGYDITFTNALNQELPFEIQSYNATNGTIEAWVKLDEVKTSENTIFYLYYGNPNVSANPSSPNTWSNDYKAVYHFDNNLNDASSNGNDGTNNGSDDAAGKVGRSIDLDGNDYVEVPYSSSLDISGKTLTMSAWVKVPNHPSDDAPFAVKGPSDNNESYMFGVDGGTSPTKINSRIKTSSGYYRHDAGSLPDNSWTLVHFVYDGNLGSNQKRIYVNGNLSYDEHASGNILTGNDNLLIGKRLSSTRYLDGRIDELRISDAAKSADWIKTEYNNQNNPSTFITATLDKSCAWNTLSGFVFQDANVDTIFNQSDETGQAGVTVSVYRDANNNGVLDGSDNLLTTLTTDGDGFYSYSLEYNNDNRKIFITTDTATYPAGRFLTTDNIEEAQFTGTSQTDENNNFGFIRSNTITGTVFVDYDKNGDYDAGSEDIVPNVGITLWRDVDKDGKISAGDTVVDNTTTDNNGFYQFNRPFICEGESESIDSFELQISNSNDDSEESSSYTDALWMEVGQDDKGLRFRGMQIPQGAEILESYITLTADRNTSGLNSITIDGEAIGNAPIFQNQANNITNRTRTTASSSWNDFGNWSLNQEYQTSDLSDIVQEIVNRNDWSSGNAMAFIFNEGDQCNFTGNGLYREVWKYISGSDVSHLTSHSNYPNHPTYTSIMSDFNGPDNIHDNYGTRVRGYIVPSVSGNYTFNVTGDDNTELYLSTDQYSSNKTKIAEVTGWSGTTEHTKYGSQTSTTISLQAGETYYVELLHKEGGGADHFQVYWKTPNNNSWTIIPNGNLRYGCNTVFPTAYFYDNNSSRSAKLFVKYKVTNTGICNEDYVVQVNQNTLPLNTELTTDSMETANFTEGGQTDPENDFGIIGQNVISGYVFRDANNDTIFNTEEFGQAGVRVRLFTDLNGNGRKDANEPAIDSTLTGVGGFYEFVREYGGGTENYVISTDTNTYPGNTELTTDNIETASFNGFGQSDLNNNFGFNGGGGIGCTGQADNVISSNSGSDASTILNIDNIGFQLSAGEEVVLDLTDTFIMQDDLDIFIRSLNGTASLTVQGSDDGTDFSLLGTVSTSSGTFVSKSVLSAVGVRFVKLINNGLNGLEVDGVKYNCDAVPVEMLYFKASLLSPESSLLEWATASEINNDRFEIERRLESEREFSYIGEVQGVGNSTQINQYRFVDEFGPIKDKIIYYRLRQVDFDGQFEYSQIAFVQLSAAVSDQGRIVLNAFPNPARDQVNVILTNSNSRAVIGQVQIIDNKGSDVSDKVKINQQSNMVQMDVSALQTGIYQLVIERGNEVETVRLVVSQLRYR